MTVHSYYFEFPLSRIAFPATAPLSPAARVAPPSSLMERRENGKYRQGGGSRRGPCSALAATRDPARESFCLGAVNQCELRLSRPLNAFY
jgi:hypothetical protein